MDDIDIEEHDVLDDPKLQGMFPDLSRVKDEPLDAGYEGYGGEVYQPASGFDYLDIKPEPPDEVEDTDPQESIENTPEEDIPSDKCDGETFETPTQVEQNPILLGLLQNPEKPNKVVIGSKLLSESSHCSTEPRFLTVLLEDWAQRLSLSPSYCADCEILFATPNALDAHKMVAHSFLVARHVNKAVKSTTPRNKALKSTSKSEGQPSGSKFCHHCSTMFPSDTELIKHLYQLLPLAPKNNFSCDECSLTFETHKDLSDHKKRHASAKLALSGHFTCQFCDVQFLNYKQVWRHKRKYHKDLAPKKAIANLASTITSRIVQLISKSSLFKCTNCGCHFLTAFVGISHMNKCLSLETPSTRSVDCNICQRKLSPLYIQDHIKQHEHTDNIDVYNINDVRGWTLCRCPSCDVCFEEYPYRLHCKTDCDGSQDAAETCDQCNVKVDGSKIHLKKHIDNPAKKFLIIEFFHDKKPVKRKLAPQPKALPVKKVKLKPSENATQDIAQKTVVMYYCSKCECCRMYRDTVGAHKESCDINSRRVCNQCGIFVASNTTLKNHWGYHKKMPISIADVVFMDIDTNEVVTPPPPKYPWCKLCKARVLNIQQHECGVHKTTTCGVCYTKLELPAYELHVEFHKLQKKSPAKPHTDPPDSGMSALLQKYESIRSVWNIIFQCTQCDIASDSYDRAVVHSQQHWTKTKCRIRAETCSLCNLSFFQNDYYRHKDLHARNVALKANDFLLLKYNHEHLMGNKWFDLFKGLPDTQVQQIVSQSMYAHVRSVRMVLLQPGRPELTIYICLKCKLFVDIKNITAHIRACPETTGYRCIHCKLRFESRKGLQAHLEHHKRGATRNCFRVLKFNQHKYNRINNILAKTDIPKKLTFFTCTECNISVTERKSISKESHNCIEEPTRRMNCDHCGLDFSKRGFVHHLLLHAKLKNLNQSQIRVIPVNPLNTEVDDTTSSSKKTVVKMATIYKFYQCAGCKVSCQNVLSLTDLHRCREYRKRIACPICPNLVFTVQGFVVHRSMHYKYKNMNKSTVKITVVNKELKGDQFVGQPIVKGVLTAPSHQPASATAKGQSKYIFYQCSRCKICCRNERPNHDCAKIKRRITCTACSLVFSAQAMERHELLHHRFKNMNENTVAVKTLKFTKTPYDIDDHGRNADEDNTVSESESEVLSQMGKLKKAASLNFYKCATCRICFRNRHDQKNRVHSCNPKKRTYKCSICKIAICLQNADRHVRLHKKFNFNRNTIKIIPFHKETNDEIQPTEHDPDAIDADSLDGDDCGRNTKKTLNKGEYLLYKCSVCKVCCRKACALDSSSHKCRPGRKLFRCRTCKIDFSGQGYERHQKLHRVYKNLNKQTVRIVQVNPTVEPTYLKDSDDLKPTYRFFQCVTCKMCCRYMNKLLEKNHKCQNLKMIKCRLCNLQFSYKSYRSHWVAHKTLKNMNAETVYVIPVNQSQIDEDCDTQDETEDAETIVTNCDSIDSEYNDLTQTDLDKTANNEGVKATYYYVKPNVFRMYQCTTCSTCYSSKTNFMESHSCDEEKSYCDACEVSIPQRERHMHSRRHQRQPKLSAETLEIELLKPARVFYRCNNCLVCAIDYRFRINHRCVTSDNRMYCDKCEQYFSKRAWKYHAAFHSKLQVSSENIEIVTFESQCPITDDTDVSQNTLALEESSIAHDEVTEDSSVKDDEEANEDNSVDFDATANNVNSPVKCIQIYKCECGLHVTSKTQAKSHALVCDPNASVETKNCPKCGLRFIADDLIDHLARHPKSDSKYVVEEFKRNLREVVVLSGKNVVKRVSYNRTNSDHDYAIVRENKVAKVYKCKCGLHFTSLNSIGKHANNCGSGDISAEHCSKCGLLFPTEVLVSHLCCHHSSNTQIIVEEFVKNDDKSSEHDEALRDEPSNVQLYKCGHCDVYYLTEDECSDHTSNHKSLNSKDYIKCKICDLQFEIQSLHQHMTKHHESKFDLKNVVINEYQPVSADMFNVETYYAWEKVQSEVVTSSNDQNSFDLAKVINIDTDRSNTADIDPLALI